jgi:hypothetical protein
VLKKVDRSIAPAADEPSVDDVMDQIRNGFKLKSVDTSSAPPLEPQQPAAQQSAAQAMVDALAKRRGVVSKDSDEEEMSDDDWSD